MTIASVPCGGAESTVEVFQRAGRDEKFTDKGGEMRNGKTELGKVMFLLPQHKEKQPFGGSPNPLRLTIQTMQEIIVTEA